MFCPQEAAWGNIADWVSAVATAVAAGGLIVIARKDWRNREKTRQETIATAATLIYPDLLTAIIFFKYVPMRLPDEPWGHSEGFLRRRIPEVTSDLLALRFSSISERFDLSPLGGVAQEVRFAEDDLRREQEKFLPGTEIAGYAVKSQRWCLLDAAARLHPILMKTANSLHEEKFPGSRSPWEFPDPTDATEIGSSAKE